MKVLACGSRDYQNWYVMGTVLGKVFEGKNGILIHGKARGADSLAGVWARANGIVVLEFPADWSKGRSAGHIRNQQMIDQKPDLVVAFKSKEISIGTDNCLAKAKKAGIPTIVVVGSTLPEGMKES